MDAEGLVEGVVGDTELLRPVMDVGADLGVDLVGAAGAVLDVVCHGDRPASGGFSDVFR